MWELIEAHPCPVQAKLSYVNAIAVVIEGCRTG